MRPIPSPGAVVIGSEHRPRPRPRERVRDRHPELRYGTPGADGGRSGGRRDSIPTLDDSVMLHSEMDSDQRAAFRQHITGTDVLG